MKTFHRTGCSVSKSIPPKLTDRDSTGSPFLGDSLSTLGKMTSSLSTHMAKMTGSRRRQSSLPTPRTRRHICGRDRVRSRMNLRNGILCPEVRICRVRLFNHRTDVKFLFIREFLGRPRVLGESPVIKLRRGGYPLSVHLALTDKEKCVRHRVTPLTDCLVRCGCSGSRRRGRSRWCSGGPSQESSTRKRSQSGRRTHPRTCAVLRPRLCASCFCMKRLTSVLFV